MSTKQSNTVALGMVVIAIAALVAVGSICSARADGDKLKDRYQGSSAPFGQVVSTTAVKILPERGGNPPAFAAGTVYSQGDTVVSYGNFYMCVTTNSAGTAGTNAPSGRTTVINDGTNTWRWFPGGPRVGVWLYNAGTNTIRIGVGYVPTATTGGALLEGGTWYEDGGNIQAAIYAIGIGPTNGFISGIDL